MSQEGKCRISLIIPVYNVENYVESCLQSAMNQNFSDYEVIIIDDGSTDGSFDICKKYAEVYKNINLIHKKNEGLMAAWLEGLSLAQGDYVAFLDSDDWIEREYLCRLAVGIDKNAEVTCCNKKLEYGEYNVILKEPLKKGLYERKEIVDEIFPVLLNNGTYLGRTITPHRCGKLFKKKILLENICYCNPQISFGEDLNIFFPVMLDCQRLLILEDEDGLYHYRQNRKSIARAYKKNMLFEIYKLREQLLEINRTKAVFDFREQICRDFFCLFLEWVKNETKSNKRDRDIASFVLKKFCEESDSFSCINRENFSLGFFNELLLRNLKRKSICGLTAWIFLYRRVKRNIYVGDWKYSFQKKERKYIKVLMLGPHKSVRGGIRTVIDNYLKWNYWKNSRIIFIPTYIEKNIVIKALFFIIHFIEIFIICLIKKIDIVHLHVSERGSFYRKATVISLCKKMKIKTVLHHHGAEFFDFFDNANKKRKTYITEIINDACINIVLSENQKNKMKIRFPDAKFIVLYNAVAESVKNCYNDKANDILFVGRLGKRKGVFDLIEVFKMSTVFQNENIVLNICGDGALKEVKEKIEEKQIQGRVKHIGWCSKQELERTYKETMMFILPSYNEGLPMALLEAMSYGIPCIASRIAAIPEVITDGENGLLITPGNIVEIRRAIEYLAGDSQLRKKIGEKAYESVQKKFLAVNGIERLEKIYIKLKYNK